MNDLPSMRTQAQLLRCGYALGYYSKSQIESWAERWIADVDHPSLELIELATIRNVDEVEVLKLLESIGGEAEPFQFISMALGFWGQMYLDEKATLQNAIGGIWNLLPEPGITEEQRAIIYYLDDAYDLAINGSWGSINETAASLREFLTPYSVQLTEQTKRLIIGS